LRSLMLDQVTNLKEQYLIDAVGYVNSQRSVDEREAVLAEMRAGHLQFMFIAPERLQSRSFRNSLVEVTSAFSMPYAVIDEAHCISEWGHDFRTSYLNAARIIQEHCQFQGKRPTIVALTGTASYSVLIDIQREVEVFDDEALVLPPSFDREEIEFGVYSVPTDQKWQKLAGILRSLPAHFHIPPEHFFDCNGEQTAAGIIFVPHVNGPYGVLSVAEKIQKELKIPVKIYSGSLPKNWTGNGNFEMEKEQIQQEFKNNEIPLLVATKAFGMGIDKPNIRYTIHYNIPPSLEAFYQEVGRAGRDQKKAFSVLLFSDDRSAEVSRALDPTSSVEEVRNIPRPDLSHEGDISRLFWFHSRAFQGESEEHQKIIQVFTPIYRALGQVTFGNMIHTKVPFNGYSSDDERVGIEKALYRLSVIGAIDDYTIDFKHHCFEITAQRRDEEGYIAKVKEYVARYKTPLEVAEVPDRIRSQPVDGIIYKCTRYLLSFIYQEVEKKRRAAIRTMVEMTRQASIQVDPNTFVRQEIIAYMKQTPVNDLLLKMVRRMNSKEWWEILNLRNEVNELLIGSENGARQLLGGCRRTLESFPDHPGLLFLSGISRLFLMDQDIQEAFNDLRAGLYILEKRKEPRKEAIAIELLDVIEKKCVEARSFDEVRSRIASDMIQLFPTRDIARRVFSILPEAANSILVQQVWTRLHFINQTLKGEV
jgi:ATP-dependent DNA helicase RecQ